MWPDHPNIASFYELCFHARSSLNRCQNKRSGFSSSTGFLTVRLASGIWLSVTYKHQKHLNKPSSPPPYWTPASFLCPRTEAYPSGPPIFCVVSIILCCVSVILCCVSTTLCCVSIILCCVLVILCCVSAILLCFENFVLCFDNFVLCFDNFVLCFDNFLLCFTKLTCVPKILCCASSIIYCVCRYGPP